MKSKKSVILLVDDKPSNLLALENLLATDDRRLLKAESGQEALKMALEEDIDLVILDVQMPAMDGFEVAQILKSKKKTRGIPIIFATAESKERKFVIQGYDEGGIDYLFKPLDPDIVKGKVTVLLRVQEQQREIIEQELALRQQKLITEVTIQAQEKQRTEIGRELHDNINQILATVKMYLKMTDIASSNKEELIRRCTVNVDLAIEEIRKLSRALVTPSLGDMGLVVALQELADEINLAKEVQVNITSRIDRADMRDPDMELMLYRIAQEQLNNIRKYAHAKVAEIELTSDNQNIYFAISDDGVGFDPARKAKGIGLKNISSRVDFYSGKMKVTTAAGKGCRLDITIPIKQANKQDGPHTRSSAN